MCQVRERMANNCDNYKVIRRPKMEDMLTRLSVKLIIFTLAILIQFRQPTEYINCQQITQPPISQTQSTQSITSSNKQPTNDQISQSNQPKPSQTNNNINNYNNALYHNSAASAMKFFKTLQASACDGESLTIQCNEDYIIDVITAERTILNETSSLNNGLCSSKPESSSQDDQYQQQQQPKRSKRNTTLTTSSTSFSNIVNCNDFNAQTKSLRENITTLVKSICWKTNSCNIDLKLSSSSMQQQLAQNDSITTLARHKQNLSFIMNEQCSGQRSGRKLLEIIYKCRPQTFKRTYICRGQPLILDCPPEKRLLIPWAEYGFSPGDMPKALDRCSADKQRLINNTDSANARSNSSMNQVSCISPTGHRSVMAECLLKPRCRVDPISAAVFGEPQCDPEVAQTLPQLLKFNHFCANESLLLEPVLHENFVKNLLTRQSLKEAAASSSTQTSAPNNNNSNNNNNNNNSTSVANNNNNNNRMSLTPQAPYIAFNDLIQSHYQQQNVSLMGNNYSTSESEERDFAKSAMNLRARTQQQHQTTIQDQQQDPSPMMDNSENQLIIRRQNNDTALNDLSIFEVVSAPVLSNSLNGNNNKQSPSSNNNNQQNLAMQLKMFLTQHGAKITLFSICLTLMTLVTVISLLIRAWSSRSPEKNDSKGKPNAKSSKRSKSNSKNSPNSNSSSACSSSESSASSTTSSTSTKSSSLINNRNSNNNKNVPSSIQMPLKHSPASISPSSFYTTNNNNAKQNPQLYKTHRMPNGRTASTSESYFSLADYNLSANNNNNNNSISGLTIHQGCFPAESYSQMDSNQHLHQHHENPNFIHSTMTMQQQQSQQNARPRLWTIHSNGNQRYNTTSGSHLRMLHNKNNNPNGNGLQAGPATATYQHAKTFFPVVQVPPQLAATNHGAQSSQADTIICTPNSLTDSSVTYQQQMQPNAARLHHQGSITSQDAISQYMLAGMNSQDQLQHDLDHEHPQHQELELQQQDETPELSISQELEKAAEYFSSLASGPNLTGEMSSLTADSRHLNHPSSGGPILAQPPPQYNEHDYWQQHQRQSQLAVRMPHYNPSDTTTNNTAAATIQQQLKMPPPVPINLRQQQQQ